MRKSASFITSELASNLRADLDIMKTLSKYVATFAFLLSHYEADLDTLEQLFRPLVTFNFFPNNLIASISTSALASNLRANLNILKYLSRDLPSSADFDTMEQLLRNLRTFTLVLSNHSKHVHLYI